ncbi:bZIP transcription factor 1 [Phytophthora citrophthora]|uniref:BZIP transcription factor 1 n=1 Tax=Phytophthora citrophthora TaxID=4793 RepID=A0AAD9G985_9STRA|nr:bZIP transcription factor 1 [Phytophthora citrophthora]
MANLLRNPSLHFVENFDSYALPQISSARRQVGPSRGRHDASTVAPFAPRTHGDNVPAADAATTALLSFTHGTGSVSDSLPTGNASAVTNTTGKRKRSAYYSTSTRRHQSRANQARYRERQRAAQFQLQQSVEDLHKEVDSLKRQYHEHSSLSSSNQSPWSVVAEVFHLIESSFRSPWCMTNSKEIMGHKATRRVLASIKKAFAHDATMGNLVGADALMTQLRYYNQYFGEPQLKLQRIETVASGVMAAKAKLSVTVTELTLRHIFPHAVKLRDTNHYASEQHSLYDRLLGQRLELPGSMCFFFDEYSHQVVRLETRIDLVPALLRSLRNLKDVCDVMEHALVTLDCVIHDGLSKLAPGVTG